MSFLLEVVTFFVPTLALDGAKTAPFRTHDLLLTGALACISPDVVHTPVLHHVLVSL